ncbi:MAG: hypothetical protein WKF47_06400 [Geodermatophilaceae bacterium]
MGLTRTEHMFFEGDRIDAMREMILAENVEDRRSRARQAAAVSARRLHRHLQGAQGLPGDDPFPRSAAARVPPARRSRAAARSREKTRHQRPKHRAARAQTCTSSTRCSATAVAASASPIRRSPRCRPAPSSKPPPMSRRRRSR